ncbi:MAG: cytochrome b [Proteobacteria bacterium]|nr:cytochrome b [Pseudomonadota bacterium]
MSAPARYNCVAVTLHWVIALAFLTMFVIAFTGMELDGKTGEMLLGLKRWDWYVVHKSLGVAIFVLVALRIVWRFTTQLPTDDTSPKWDVYISRLNFVLLYVVMIGMPLTGYVMSAAGGHPINWFWLGELPNLLPLNKPLASTAHDVHTDVMPIVIYVIVGLHFAGAMFHYFIFKDNVLWKMLPLSCLKRR